MRIEPGDIIEIDGEKYDVLTKTLDIDSFDRVKNEVIGQHVALELHKFNDKSILPTHILKIYDKNNVVLKRIIPVKINLEKTRTRGDMVSYKDEKRIKLKDIKIINEV